MIKTEKIINYRMRCKILLISYLYIYDMEMVI